MTTATVRQWDIELPFMRPPLSANQRLYWAKKARMTAQVRRTSAYLVKGQVPPCDRVKVRLLWCVSDRRRRDPSNVMPTQKAVVDGLVDAGVVPDDTPEFVVEEMPVVELVGKGAEGVFVQVIGSFSP